ncbi:hypothetical protein FACS189475_00470 [Betaproteobacteria bacterium]|nr:hypothetical protein FACS189475_00470 [Betaproteobacteria bacterium]
MEYVPGDSLKDKETDVIQSDRVTYATVFAQIKITGRLDPKFSHQVSTPKRRVFVARQERIASARSRSLCCAPCALSHPVFP